MRTILLTVSYDGTDYCGWQRQSAAGNNSRNNSPVRKSVPTVQEEIETALEKIHKAPTALAGSGRTDSGVHAFGQAATFVSPIDSIPAENYVPALNSILPPDIRIIASEERPENFHARFSARSRTYKYFLDVSQNPAAHDKRFSWSLLRKPKIDVLNEMASTIIGEIDFTTFCAAGDKSDSKFRNVTEAFFYTAQDAFGKEKLIFQISANAFLWNMVRSLVGTMIEFEKSGKTKSDFQDALLSCTRTRAGITAPPTGLFLWKVEF